LLFVLHIDVALTSILEHIDQINYRLRSWLSLSKYCFFSKPSIKLMRTSTSSKSWLKEA